MLMSNDAILAKYQDALRNMPAPGIGCGCHSAIMTVANLGAMAGQTAEEIHGNIRAAIPSGKRRVSDSEIIPAIQKAISDHQGKDTFYIPPKQKPIVSNGITARQRIIEQGTITDEADLWEASPYRLDWYPSEDAARFLGVMFDPGDLLFIGDRYEAGIIGQNIRTRTEWVEYFQSGGKAGPFIIINPLDGIPKPKKSGDGDTLRGDENVKSFKHCLVEFDDLSREEQIKFWSAFKLPIRALIDTGGKSIHAWVDLSKVAEIISKATEIKTAEDWNQHIKGNLYDRILAPLGVDAACKNPARLSRLPGYFRTENKQFQRLLWLSPTGAKIND